jgi:uncharacterized membrane protein YccC
MKIKKVLIVCSIIFLLLPSVSLFAVDNLDEMINQVGNAESEVKNARYSAAKNQTFLVLRQRLDAIEQDILNIANPTGIMREIEELRYLINNIDIPAAQEVNTFHASKFIGKLRNGEPATVVFLGDSTTEQNDTTH